MTRQSVSTWPSFREQKKCCVDFVTKFQFFKVKGFLRPRHLKAMMRVGVDQNIVRMLRDRRLKDILNGYVLPNRVLFSGFES